MLWRSNTNPRHYSHINQISLLLKTKKGRIVRNTAVLLQLLFSSPFNHLWPFFPNQRTVFIHFTKIYILCLDSTEDQNGENSPSPPPTHPPPPLSFCWGKPEKVNNCRQHGHCKLSYRQTPKEVFPSDPWCSVNIFLEKWKGHSYWDKQDLDGMGERWRGTQRWEIHPGNCWWWVLTRCPTSLKTERSINRQ